MLWCELLVVQSPVHGASLQQFMVGSRVPFRVQQSCLLRAPWAACGSQDRDGPGFTGPNGRQGIPVRRVSTVLRALTGVEFSLSAIAQDALRRARGAVGDVYRGLREPVRQSAVVHVDDAGWRMGGDSALLTAFVTDDATVYQVRSRHRYDEAREIVPPN